MCSSGFLTFLIVNVHTWPLLGIHCAHTLGSLRLILFIVLYFSDPACCAVLAEVLPLVLEQYAMHIQVWAELAIDLVIILFHTSHSLALPPSSLSLALSLTFTPPPSFLSLSHSSSLTFFISLHHRRLHDATCLVFSRTSFLPSKAFLSVTKVNAPLSALVENFRNFFFGMNCSTVWYGSAPSCFIGTFFFLSIFFFAQFCMQYQAHLPAMQTMCLPCCLALPTKKAKWCDRSD